MYLREIPEARLGREASHSGAKVFGNTAFHDPESTRVAIGVGPSVHFIFSKAEVSAAEVAAAQGIHVCVYISNFFTAYKRLAEMGIIWTNPRFVELGESYLSVRCGARASAFSFAVALPGGS